MPPDHASPDLTLALPPSAREAEVMTRVLRLPTGSLRQARAIVRMQLDRLSPLPVASVLFDLVRLPSPPGAEIPYALGILRRSILRDPAFVNRRIVALARSVDGVEVTFRFRNAGAVDDRETRWLAQAPRAAALALGLAAVALAGQIRADQWREARLPVIAAEQRTAARAARDAGAQAAATADWRALDRTDAATRFLCVTGKIAAVDRKAVAVAGFSAEAGQVRVTPRDADGAARLADAGGVPATAGAGAAPVTFGSEVCQ
jgi:hypothetical protein